MIFLLPPSEGKKSENEFKNEDLSFDLIKPLKIAKNATEKDLKCIGKRFKEGIYLNKNILNSETHYAINRYSGVMFNAINYSGMNDIGKKHFENNFLILSGMFGIVKAKDKIGNYKLPIETKELYKYWWNIIPEELSKIETDYIINLLPISYSKLIGLGTNCSKHKNKLEKIINSGTKIININFLKSDGKKISHGVKKIKGEWIKNICENNIIDYNKFGGEVIINGDIIDINIIIN